MTDRELLTNYLDGDSAAFAELVRRHGDWLWGCALRQAPDSATAEDIAQAAFLLLSRKAAALQRCRSLHGWLFKVVQLLARDARKLAARRQYHEMKVAAMKPEQTKGNADWDALQSMLDSAVAKLRDADREAILLRFYEGLPLAEVARTMKLSEDAATKRVSRAVARLKAVLSGEGISTPADVQNLLSTGLSCSAPAALIAQIAASHTTPAAAALATKGAHLLASAKLKVAAALVAGTIVVASATTGVIIAARPAAPATTVLSARALAVAMETAAPPIRLGKQATAVNRTILAIRQADTDKLIAAARLVSTDQTMQTYVGSADTLQPILSTVLARSVCSASLDWQSKYASGFGTGSDSKQLVFGPVDSRELIYLEGNTTISAGKVTQIAGSVSISGWANIPSLAFAPFTIGPSEIRLQIIPMTLPRTGAVNLVSAYEAVPVDVADRDPLSQMTDAAAWFAQPRNKTLRIARAGAVWQSMVPENKSSVARLKALKLPGGASIWARCINDESVDPLAAWTADGQPADVTRAGKPKLHLQIDDPNLPPFIFSNTNVYEGWAVVPLIHKSAEGYSCAIGYGDGKYSTVTSLPAKQGATASFAGCTLTIERIGDRGGGEFRSTGTLPKDTDFDLVAVLKDGSWRWNTQRSGYVEEGKQPALPRSFSFDTNLTQITHLEIRSRPLKWVTFQRLAAGPVVALPTGMEPPVDRDESKRQLLASATPADRKAFLDKVNCVRYWGSDRSDVKRDIWLWRDGRYRAETWTRDGHTLALGDKKTAWSYEPQTGNWIEKKGAPSTDIGNFAEMMASIGGMESVIALGETVGTEPIHGTPCTIRTGRLESRTVKVWLDSLGIIHRLDCDPPEGESAIIDYNPADAEKVWTPPVAYASAEPVTRYESAAEAFLAKAMPADKPIKSITAAGRTFELLSIKSIRDDLAIICTSSELLPESRKHRDDTGERWQATQMYGIGSSRYAWIPRPIARLHMPYREITWWSLSKGSDCKEPDLAEVLVVLGEASGSFPMEGWIESQPNPTRMHPLAVDLLQADRVDLDAYLREVYQLVESYRKAVGEAGSSDFITASDTWEKFKQTADSAIAGREAVSSSGR